jgi:hypothetical protein
MPANIQQVSFQDPRLLYAPDSVVQQQQIQRQQQLADALRAQSQADMPAAPGSHVSWTQGAAKVVAALLAKQQYKKIDQGNTALAQQYASALRGQFGGGRAQPANPSPAPIQSQPAPQPVALPATGQNINIPAPNQPPQADAGPAPAMSPGGGAGPAPRGPWSLSGNQQQDMNDYMLNPEKYGEAVIAAHAPVDMSKMVRQAQEAAANGDYATAAALYGNIEKQNNIPLQPGRPGAPMFDHTGKIVAMAPQSVEGGNPVIEDGKFTGSYTQAPGVTGVVQAVNAAKAVGSAATDMVPTYDPASGNYKSVPKLDALSRPGGIISAPGPGAEQAAKSDATLGADAFKSDADAAANSNIIRGQINNIRSLGSITATGHGAEGIASFKSHVNTVLTSMGGKPWFDQNGIAQIEEIHKDSAALAQQQASALGGASGATDAKLASAYASLPDVDKQPQTIQMITRILGARQDMVDARKNASTLWARNHGSTQSSHNEFNKQFVNAADSELFERLADMKGNPAALTQGLSKPQAAALLQKYRTLRNMGAFQ